MAITVWNVRYPLQVIGVCLSLLLIYMLAVMNGNTSRVGVGTAIVLLGKYSLFAYIAQIALLQLMREGFGYIGMGVGWMALSFLGAFGLTVVSVMVVDWARAKVDAVNRVYVAVFS
jgi:peptidoglycan/LPS O-acetylase OafA/YrhL